jgi:hypothetical protein
MASHRLFVFTQPVEGKDAEYNDWYDKIHLKEVLEIEGFVAAQRFALAEGPVDGEAPAAPAPYVAIYEIEAESMEQAMANLGAAAGTMNMSDALDLSGAKTFGYTAIGDKQHAR